MKGVVLDLGSGGSFRQLPADRKIYGIYGPMEEAEFEKLMVKRDGIPIPGTKNEWAVGEFDSLNRVVGYVRFDFAPTSAPRSLLRRLRLMRNDQ